MFSVQAGIIEEMLEDTFESMDDQEEMEEAAEMEIDRILFEITAGTASRAPNPFWPTLLILSTRATSAFSCVAICKVFLEECTVKQYPVLRNKGFLVSNFHIS